MRLVLTARMNVIVAEDVDATAHVPDHVAAERHVFDHRPWRAPVLITDRKQDREAVLCVGPVVFEDVALDEHPARILELEQVLHRPRHALVARVVFLPSQRFREVVADNLDVGGNQVGDQWIGAAKHHVLAGRFEMIVGNPEGAGPIPARNGLRIGANLLEIEEQRINDRGVA